MIEYDMPDDFVWGAATSSYQIEGAHDKDGKGESIWDRFVREKGNVKHGHTGDVACDHYHRYQEDVELMQELNLDSYRFSISWPRILPQGRGEVNQQGLKFYDNLIDELLQAGIEPMVTIYHWDLPQALQEAGGWTSRQTVEAFVEYAEILFQEFGDRVDNWITHNEPWVMSFVAHAFGEHAPGWEDFASAVQVSHNLLVSHGLTVRRFRELVSGGNIGITLDLHDIHPASRRQNDIKAAEREDAFSNRWFLDPLYKGRYPQALYQHFQKMLDAPAIQEEDMEIIQEDTDFLGINYYTRHVAKYDRDNELLGFKDIDMIGNEHTEMGWEVYPDGLYNILVRLAEEYTDDPLYITENGCAIDDKLDEYGIIHDKKRIDYYASHLKAVERAAQSGVPIAGYYAWSLMDNFEWAYGYTKRFGLTYVDFETGERTLKDSARWYSRVIGASRG